MTETRHEEQRLIARLQAGEEAAFGELLDAYETRIYRLALRQVGSETDAEDITQEVFLGIFRSIRNFRGASALSTWIYRITMNHCLEYRRKKKLDVVPYDEEVGMPSGNWRDDPVQVSSKQELSGELDRALTRLSPLHRDVILLHEMHGLTYQECAEVLNIPIGTVKSRLSNAFTRLRELMGNYVFETAPTQATEA